MSAILINARQLAVASANEAVNDEFMLRRTSRRSITSLQPLIELLRTQNLAEQTARRQ